MRLLATLWQDETAGVSSLWFPDGRVVDRGYHDVTVVDMEEEREPMVVMNDMTRL